MCVGFFFPESLNECLSCDNLGKCVMGKKRHLSFLQVMTEKKRPMFLFSIQESFRKASYGKPDSISSFREIMSRSSSQPKGQYLQFSKCVVILGMTELKQQLKYANFYKYLIVIVLY